MAEAPDVARRESEVANKSPRTSAVGNVPAGQRPDGTRSVAEASSANAELPYSPFSTRVKVTIVLITALTALVGPLSAYMYYPSIQVVRDEFHTTQSAVTWTITVFVIAMAIFPLIWSNLADKYGRKPIYVVSMLVYTCGSIGCALSRNLAALIVSRIIQAAGSSAVQSSGAGTISDIYPREQRGTAMGIYFLGPLLGPCLGPLIGGYVGQDVSWRWVFWILTIWGGIMTLLAVFVLPETHRRIVSKKYRIQQINIPPELSLKDNNPLVDILTIRYPTIALTFFLLSMVFGAFYTNTTGEALAYQNVYGLSQGTSGLCFLASGIGCVAGALIGGRVIDLLLKRSKRVMIENANQDSEEEKADLAKVKVPPEARLGVVWIGTTLFLIGIITCGWLIDKHLSLAGVLVMQFCIGAGMAFTAQGLTGYLIDAFPNRAARITGAQNFWRSVWGTAIVQLFPTILANIGWGWTYTVMFFLTLLSFVGIMLVALKGRELRAKYGPFDAP
ncbi:hypothetical protein LPJ81_004875 [Coemansia sp. IMI 209127]|nr:hypothetical protein LPJ81_004875 [Coemansia sp. IMI 209127]